MKLLLPAFLVGSLLALPFLPRVGQDPAYHQFADTRTLLGVPNFWDVISNAAFVAVGVAGLRTLRRLPTGPGSALVDARERPAWAVLFWACLLTGFGSAWYHLAPDNASLVWDRLPLAAASVSVALIVLQERWSLQWGYRLLWPVVGFALLSTPWWYATELRGAGDLRPYLWCLALPCAIVPLGFCQPARYTGSGIAWLALGLYAGARVAEVLDAEVMALPQPWSGHTWKHLLAAAAVGVFVRWLATRRPMAPPARAGAVPKSSPR